MLQRYDLDADSKCFSYSDIKGVFFKFRVEVGVEESIVNEPLVLKTLIFQTAG
jgi:hypothetical protein